MSLVRSPERGGKDEAAVEEVGSGVTFINEGDRMMRPSISRADFLQLCRAKLRKLTSTSTNADREPGRIWTKVLLNLRWSTIGTVTATDRDGSYCKERLANWGSVPGVHPLHNVQRTT